MAEKGFLSYDTKFDKAFQDGLKRAIATVGDLRPALKLIAADFYRSEKAIFQLKSAGQYPDFKGAKVADTWSNGVRARPDKRTRLGNLTAYQNTKVKKAQNVNGGGYPLLRFSGRLERSVTTPNSPDSIYRLSKQSIEIGTSVSYGPFHQSDAPRSKIPLRKFMFIGPESGNASDPLSGRQARWLNILNNFVLRSLGASPKEAGA